MKRTKTGNLHPQIPLGSLGPTGSDNSFTSTTARKLPKLKPPARTCAPHLQRAILALCCSLVGDVSLPAYSQHTTPTDRFAVAPASAKNAPTDRARVPQIRLSNLESVALLDTQNATSESRIAETGITRSAKITEPDGVWFDTGGGYHLWMVDVVSSGALAMRVHLEAKSLPPGNTIIIHPAPTNENSVHVERYDATSFDRRGGQLWSGRFEGDGVRIEYSNRGQPPLVLPFRIDAIHHIFRNWMKEEAGCNIDLSCRSEWSDVGHGVASIEFIDSRGVGGSCTGQLLRTASGDYTPYFLTASHCISTPQEAQTVQFHWLYEASNCSGAPPLSFPISSEATLVASHKPTDTSLLMVEGAIPEWRQLEWLRWRPENVSLGTPVVGIHHPVGDIKRISFGTKSSFLSTNYFGVNFDEGTTNPGSSGSGLFRQDSQELVAILSRVPAGDPCSRRTNKRYGALYRAYPTLASYLEEGSDDASEPNDDCSAAPAVSEGGYPNRILKIGSEDWYRAVVPPRTKLIVQLTSLAERGNIDARLYTECGGAIVAEANTSDNTELLTWANDSATGANAMWNAFLVNDVRNDYDMLVILQPIEEPPPPPPPPPSSGGDCEQLGQGDTNYRFKNGLEVDVNIVFKEIVTSFVLDPHKCEKYGLAFGAYDVDVFRAPDGPKRRIKLWDAPPDPRGSHGPPVPSNPDDGFFVGGWNCRSVILAKKCASERPYYGLCCLAVP